MRVRLLTENDTLPMFKNDNGVIVGAYPGVTIVNNRGSYYFGVQDFNKDGWIDACYVDLGAGFNTNLGGTRQELHSVYITMPIWPSQISGDVSQRSLFLQSGYKSHDFTQTVDNKMINGLLMNMSDNLMTSYDFNGKERIKVNYIPKTSQKDIIGN